jgi:vitamin K-dependent gamma-carboxylase
MIGGGVPLETYYTGSDIKFHFPYDGFGWLPMLPTPWIYALLVVLALAGLSMAGGFCYRASAVAVFLTWGYLYAVESTRTYFQSYYYIELLFTFLMIWVPAARKYSVDAWLARSQSRPRTVPYWAILLLRGQLVIAYFYAGVAKLNLDWLLDAAPIRWDLLDPSLTTPYEPYLTAAQLGLLKSILHSTHLAYFLCYAGVAFDLSIGFLLLVRRTRILGIILMVGFHAINHFFIFRNIDWFPLVGITTALIFLDPDWPERFWNWLRHPRFVKPDWGWFALGGVLLPPIGAALGWKLKASPVCQEAKPQPRLAYCTAPFVVVWLTWQALFPIRHYFIPGDARFTYEGISFSWRLKAEDHRAMAFQMFIKDPQILVPEGAGRVRVNWNEWHGDKVIYRRVTPGGIDWARLPEIVVLLEPTTGERILYNPYSGGNRTEGESRERVSRIWQEVYGRQPQSIGRTLPVGQVLDSVSAELRVAGQSQEAASIADLASLCKQVDRSDTPPPPERLGILRQARAVLERLHANDEAGRMSALLRLIDPFAVEGEPGRSFLLIEDSQLIDQSSPYSPKVVRDLWKPSDYTRARHGSFDDNLGGDPLVICLSDLGGAAKHMLPQACVFDSQAHPERPEYITWNSYKDLNPSKYGHASNQPFYLRRYADRVASLWKQEYGRRPVVQAMTAASLNGRPYQLLVDPTADLASVPVLWFRHNSWIKDLEMPRIPPEGLARAR